MRTWGLAGMAMMWAFACCGCHAQVSAAAEVRAVDQDDPRWEQPPAEGAGAAPLRTSASAPGPGVIAPPQGVEGVGYRVVHDLTLKAGASADLSCGCLALSIAPADDARFVWQSEAARGSHDVLALAIASATCDRPERSAKQVSIAGITHEADNVVLTVEKVRDGVPVMRGALLPRAAAGAQLIVRSRDRGLGLQRANARGSDGADCRLALP